MAYLLSLVCSLIAMVAVFLICVYLGSHLDRLTGEKYSGLLSVVDVVAGIILAIIFGNFVRDLIYRKPPRF